MFANQFYENQRLVLTGGAVIAQQVASDKWAVFAPRVYRRGQTVTHKGKYLGTADYFALPASVPKGARIACSVAPTVVGEVIATSGDWKLVTDFKALVYDCDVASYDDRSPLPKLEADFPSDWGSAVIVERPTSGGFGLGVVVDVAEAETASGQPGHCVFVVTVPGAGRGALVPTFRTPAGQYLLAKYGDESHPHDIEYTEVEQASGAIVGPSRLAIGFFPAAIGPGVVAYPDVDALQAGSYPVRIIAAPYNPMSTDTYHTVIVNAAEFKLFSDHLEVTSANLEAFKGAVSAAGASLRSAVARLRNPQEHELPIEGVVFASAEEPGEEELMLLEELALHAESSILAQEEIDGTEVTIAEAATQGAVCIAQWLLDGEDGPGYSPVSIARRVYAADACVTWWDVDE